MAKLTNEEREEWIMNDEGLYTMFSRSRLSMRKFIQVHREIIDQAIDRVLNKEPK